MPSVNHSDAFPFEISFVDEETNKKLLEDFKAEKTGFVQVGPEKYFFPSKYVAEAEKYYNTEIREDDIWIVTFPRSGTTLTQELIWLIGNDLDYEKASEINLLQRFPFFEFDILVDDDLKEHLMKENCNSKDNQKFLQFMLRPGWEILPLMESPRYIKTHLPLSLLPKNLNKCKTIYVARNPKDVAVSYFHLNRLFKTLDYQGEFPEYWEYFEQNLQIWAPYWSHMKEGCERRNDPNVLFLFYENITKNMHDSIKKVADFLGKTLTEDQILKLEDHLKIENFKQNKSVNGDRYFELKYTKPYNEKFVRGGKGNDRSEFTKESLDRANKWVDKNLEELSSEYLKLVPFADKTKC